MNTKYKLIAVTLLSVVVLAGGGAIWYNQLTDTSLGYNDGVSNYTVIQPAVIPAVTLEKGQGRRAASSGATSTSALLPSISSGAQPASQGISVQSSGSGFAHTGGLYGARKRESAVASTGSSDAALLAFGGGGKTKSGAGVTVSGGGSATGLASVGTSGTPAFVPFTGGTQSQILVDPSTDPDQNTRIPAGDGRYVLLLLSLLYAGVVYRRKK